MKVLYLTSVYPNKNFPQYGIFCHQQVKELIKMGVDVDVYVVMPFYSKDWFAPRWHYEGVDIHYLRFFKVPFSRNYLNLGKRVYKALRGENIFFSQYNLVHAQGPISTGDAARIINRKYGIPYVVHSHGLDVFLENNAVPNRVKKAVFKRCKDVFNGAGAITCVSNKVAKNITSRIGLQEKCITVYNGVDCSVFKPQPKDTVSNDIKIISVGNLVDLKGHDLSVSAVKLLLDEGYNVHLDIFGRGPTEQKLNKQVQDLGIENAVSFKGYVSYQEIANALTLYDVFLLPSWYEALGCVYLEAMASGLISIGCKGNGIDEIIGDGVNGFLVEPHSVEDIFQTIKRIINLSEEEQKQIKNAARQTVETKYGWKNSAESLLSAYESTLNQ